MRISDWSSDVCSSDLQRARGAAVALDRPDLERLALVGSEIAQRLDGDAPGALEGGDHQHRLVGLVLQHSDVAGCDLLRSEERRVGKECVSPCRSRWSPYH